MKFGIVLLSALIGLATAAPTPEAQGSGLSLNRRDSEPQGGDAPHGSWRYYPQPRGSDLPHSSWRRYPKTQSTNSPKGNWKRQNTTSLHPSFTHTWTDTPGLGSFTASSTGRVRFPTYNPTLPPIETDQTFFPDASLRGQVGIVGFDVSPGKLADETTFQVFVALPGLVLENGTGKSDINNQRDLYVARFIVRGGIPQLVEGETGRFLVPNSDSFVLQVVGSYGANFEFDAAAGEGLTVTKAG